MKVFLDANVILDFYQVRDEFFQPAAQIFDLAFKNRLEILTSPQNFINADYILRKYYSQEEVNIKLKALLNLCSVTSLTGDLISNALSLDWSDFEDCTQYLSALDYKVDFIITRNKKDFLKSEITVLTPVEFLSLR